MQSLFTLLVVFSRALFIAAAVLALAYHFDFVATAAVVVAAQKGNHFIGVCIALRCMAFADICRGTAKQRTGCILHDIYGIHAFDGVLLTITGARARFRWLACIFWLPA